MLVKRLVFARYLPPSMYDSGGGGSAAQQTRDIEPMLVYSWASAAEMGSGIVSMK